MSLRFFFVDGLLDRPLVELVPLFVSEELEVVEPEELEVVEAEGWGAGAGAGAGAGSETGLDSVLGLGDELGCD
jgi:hypothetical protein